MEIYIHFGPPKCGTSSIQKWCLDNNSFLLRNKIYYPLHCVDVNGIGSGNYCSLFTQDTVDFSKLEGLFSTANKLSCTKILLSSEFFFNRILSIAGCLNNVKFIGYIRFGFDLHYSFYNQAVKRHGCTCRFEQYDKDSFLLEHLAKKVSILGRNKFELNFLSKSFLLNGVLSHDFINKLGIAPTNSLPEVDYLNPSYSIEAIEIKRWFNQVYSEVDISHLDYALQSYKGTSGIVFLSPEKYFSYKKKYLMRLRRFLSVVSLERGQEFYNYCCSKEIEVSENQSIDDYLFVSIVSKLLHEKKVSSYYLSNVLYCLYLKVSIVNNPNRINLLLGELPFHLKLLLILKVSIKKIRK